MISKWGQAMGGYWVGSIKLTIPCNCKGLASRLPGILPIGVPAKQTEPPTMDLNSTAASYSNQHRAKPQGQPHYHHITTHQNMRFVDGIPLLNVDTDIYMDRSKLLLWINTNLPTALHAMQKKRTILSAFPLNRFGQIAPLICIDPIMDFEQSDIGFLRDIPILSDIIPFPRFIWFARIMLRNKRHMIHGTSLEVYSTYKCNILILKHPPHHPCCFRLLYWRGEIYYHPF